MNRLRWLLSGLLALLLALTAGLVLMVHAGQSMGHNHDERTGAFVSVPSPTPPPLTAHQGYLAALPAAQAWADDAQLWQAQASWPPGSDLKAPPRSWNYSFYAPSREATAVVNVAPETVKLLRTRPAAEMPVLASIDAWLVDSVEAFDLLYASGGEAFLTIHPQRTMILTLHASQSLRWEVTLIGEGAIGNAAGRQIFSLVFNAEDGELITTPVKDNSHEQD